MIKLFKNKEKQQSTNDIIEKIHESFFTEVDKLLEEAKIANSLDTDKQELIDKRNRLRSLGFVKTKEMMDAKSEIQRLGNLKIENEKKNKLIEAINYFSLKYPTYKFITVESVKKICEKYGLVYGEISKYTGTVPDSNLKQMEDFKIHEDDECYHKFHNISWNNTYNYVYATLLDFTNYEYERSLAYQNGNFSGWFKNAPKIEKLPLEIVAPLKDFDMSNSEIKDFKVSQKPVQYPIVLKPVIFKSEKYYLIVTAWGIESSDQSVVNEKMN